MSSVSSKTSYGARSKRSYSTSKGSSNTKGQRATSAEIVSSSFDRDIPTLDRIHFLFLLYSGAHNLINAWHRAENALFFIFVFVGILSVELMLYSVYKHWKDGRLVGPMLRVALFAGGVAMFYATAGILAQAQSASASTWILMYYQWILPTSAPVMFLFSFWIQSVDPIMTADRDQIAYEHLIAAETKKAKTDKKKLTLNERKDLRRLESHIKNQKLVALWRESNSRRTRRTLKNSARYEFPLMLRKFGISDPSSRAVIKKFEPRTHLTPVEMKELKNASGIKKK